MQQVLLLFYQLILLLLTVLLKSFFLFQVSSIIAQKDNPFKSAKLKLDWDEPAKVKTEANTTKLPYKSIFDKDESYLKRYSILNQKKGEESVMVQKSEFKNPGEEIKKKLNNWEDKLKIMMMNYG